MTNEELKAKYSRIGFDHSQVEQFKDDVIDGLVIPAAKTMEGTKSVASLTTADIEALISGGFSFYAQLEAEAPHNILQTYMVSRISDTIIELNTIVGQNVNRQQYTKSENEWAATGTYSYNLDVEPGTKLYKHEMSISYSGGAQSIKVLSDSNAPAQFLETGGPTRVEISNANFIICINGCLLSYRDVESFTAFASYSDMSTWVDVTGVASDTVTPL